MSLTQHPGPNSIPSSATQARQQLRLAMLARRQALTPAVVAADSAAIGQHLEHYAQQNLPLAGRRVAFCWPMQNEPDLRPLLESWQQIGVVPLLPVVLAPGQPLAFRAWQAEVPLALDRYGIPFPASGPELRPEVLLLPCNAFDAQGYRLGYGGGFFDRTLAALAAATVPPLAIGVAYAFQQVADTWPQAHDWPLAAVVTEQGVVPARRADVR